MRPHDVELSTVDHGGTVGTVTRVFRVGFEVRVDVEVGDQTVNAIVTRAQHRALGIDVGTKVWLNVAPDAAGGEVIQGNFRTSA